MVGIKIVRASKSLAALVLVLVAFPSLACFQVYSHGELKSSDRYQTHNVSGHNVGRVEYNASLDGWVIVESYYDPLANMYEAQSGDFVWASPTGSNSILFVPSSSSGGGGTPPGPNPPPTIPNADHPSSDLTTGPGILSCGSSTEPPKKLGDLGVIGVGITIMRNWLSGVSSAWAIIRTAPPGGSGSPPGSTAANPSPTPGEAPECYADEPNRLGAAGAQIRAAVSALGCLRQLHRGRYWKVDFPGGESGVYRGVGDCRMSINSVEVEAPSC